MDEVAVLVDQLQETSEAAYLLGLIADKEKCLKTEYSAYPVLRQSGDETGKNCSGRQVADCKC